MRRYVAGAVAVALLMLLAYCRGVENGESDEKLRQNAEAIDAQDSVTRAGSIRADSATKETAVAEKKYDAGKSRVRVVVDTVIVDSSRVYVDPTLADRIRDADELVARQKGELARKDILIASLRMDKGLRDDRIKLLEAKKMPRLSHGMQAGGGYCATATGQTPCVYIGYGGQFRL